MTLQCSEGMALSNQRIKTLEEKKFFICSTIRLRNRWDHVFPKIRVLKGPQNIFPDKNKWKTNSSISGIEILKEKTVQQFVSRTDGSMFSLKHWPQRVLKCTQINFPGPRKSFLGSTGSITNLNKWKKQFQRIRDWNFRREHGFYLFNNLCPEQMGLWFP